MTCISHYVLQMQERCDYVLLVRLLRVFRFGRARLGVFGLPSGSPGCPLLRLFSFQHLLHASIGADFEDLGCGSDLLLDPYVLS